MRGVMGPIGSGKSVGCIQEIFRLASLQVKGYDGLRRSRWAITRNTYAELKTTTIKTWLDWFPYPITKIVYDAPIRANVDVNDVRLEIYFISLEKEKDVKKLLSLELTGIFFNEARETRKSLIDGGMSRTGRYPSKENGGFNWSGAIMDTNPPDDDHWWYKAAEEECPKNWKFYQQPPAMIEFGNSYIPNIGKAENVQNHELGFDYWARLIPGKTKEWIKVYIQGLYGSVQDGRPCYPEYNDFIHSADKLEVLRGLPLIIGFDFGRTPTAIITQLSPMGQFRILDELVVDTEGEGMGIRKFCRDVVVPHLANEYAGMSIISFGDPAGVAKGDDERSAFDFMEEEGIIAEPAGSNAIDFRLDNVSRYMSIMVNGEPGMILDRGNCKTIRKGFLGGYKIERLQIKGDTRYKSSPLKNKYSHPHDGLQYAAYGVRFGMIKSEGRVIAQEKVTPHAGAWS